MIKLLPLIPAWSLFDAQVGARLGDNWKGIENWDNLDVFQKLILTLEKERYNKAIRPNYAEKPVSVGVTIYVGSLRSISEQTVDYKLELYFREYWTDDRLAFNPVQFADHSLLYLHESMAEQVWVPDTFFTNAIDSTNPSPGSITHRSLLRISTTGEVLYSRRLSVTAECPMNLGLYPFDEQLCLLSIESYGYSTKDIVYEWKTDGAVQINKELQLPAFQVKKVIQNNRTISLTTGEYSRLETCFIFKRSAAFYFVQLFVPAMAIVTTAWLCIYMEHESSFSDMINVILAITFLYYSYNSVMPKVSYLKAMDVFLGTCFIFVFGALFTLVAMKSLKDLIERFNKDNEPTVAVRNNSKTRRSKTPETTSFISSTDRGSTNDDADNDNILNNDNAAATETWVRSRSDQDRGSLSSICLRFIALHHRRIILVTYPMMFIFFCSAFFLSIWNRKRSTTIDCQF